MPKRFAKGEERREQLMRTALALVEENDLPDVSMHKIAAAAGIPSGSAYHFFDGPGEVFTALARQFRENVRTVINAPCPEAALDGWQSLFRKACQRGVTLYEENPAYCQLILAGTSTPEIKVADQGNDLEIGKYVGASLDHFFVLPEVEDRDTRLFHAMEIFDQFLAFSYQRLGGISPDAVDEGAGAAIAYQRQFIPDRIPRRKPAET